MTMFPAAHHQQKYLSKHNRYSGFGGGCGTGSGDGRSNYSETTAVYHEYSSVIDQACIGSDDLMAEDESRTESNNNEVGSSTKEDEKDDGGWLQLSLGGRTNTTSSSSHDQLQKLDQTVVPGTSDHLIELDLLPPGGGGRGGSNSQPPTIRPFNLAPGPFRPTIFHLPEFRAPFPTNASLFLQGSPSSSTMFPYHQLQDANYLAFRPSLGNVIPSSSFPNSLVAAPRSYFARAFHVGGSGGGGGMDVAGPSLDFRVVEPPRRPQSGIWFMLQASQNQGKEPYLPQIPKSYIRIKDGRMTIRLLLKYLVNKLRLDNESEVEITCRGQQLLPFLTLQHVRDNIWKNTATSLRNVAVPALTSLPHSTPPATTTDHLMVLHYGRIA